jgi:hypothetical protein
LPKTEKIFLLKMFQPNYSSPISPPSPLTAFNETTLPILHQIMDYMSTLKEDSEHRLGEMNKATHIYATNAQKEKARLMIAGPSSLEEEKSSFL